MMPLIELKEVTAGFGNRVLLQQLSWKLELGEHWLIRGPVGSGKTSLAKLLCKKARIFTGEVCYDTNLFRIRSSQPDIHMVSFTDESKLFHGVNAMHYYQQRYNAFDADGHLTARQYLENEGFKLSGYNHLIEGLEIAHLLERERIKLSSGQTRRLLLAKALLSMPRILILDNAYIGLDAEGRKTFNRLIDHLAAEESCTFILIGNPEKPPHCITRSLLLHKGRIVGQLPKMSDTWVDKIRPVKEYFLTKTKPPSLPVIEMKNVSVRYLDTPIISNFNWTVQPGEKWAFTGPNGSGKSTLLALIYADHPQAYSNQVKLFGRQRGKGESIWEVKQNIGFTSAEMHSYFHYPLTGLELVLTGLKDSFVVPKKPTPLQTEIAHLFFSLFEVENLKKRLFHQMSTGEQRLMFFFRALIKAPTLLLLDEPFQGMDEQLTRRCKTLLTSILDDRHTMIFVSHIDKEIPKNVNLLINLASKGKGP